MCAIKSCLQTGVSEEMWSWFYNTLQFFSEFQTQGCVCTIIRSQPWKLIDSCLFTLPTCSKAILALCWANCQKKGGEGRTTLMLPTYPLPHSLSPFTPGLAAVGNTTMADLSSKNLVRSVRGERQGSLRRQSWYSTSLNIILGMQPLKSDSLVFKSTASAQALLKVIELPVTNRFENQSRDFI